MALTHKSPEKAVSPNAKIHVYDESSAAFGVSKADSSRTKKIALDHLGVDVPTDEQLRELFNYFDNGTGSLDIKEFRHVFQDSFENFGAPMEDRDVDRLFAKYVGNGKANDGKMGYDEFCILVLNRLRQ
jgi:Ca2+-binding EF-hand superfamily protein